MSFDFQCPHCQTCLKAEDDRAATEVDCPACGKALTIPSPAQTAPSEHRVEADGASSGSATAPAELSGAPTLRPDELHDIRRVVAAYKARSNWITGTACVVWLAVAVFFGVKYWGQGLLQGWSQALLIGVGIVVCGAVVCSVPCRIFESLSRRRACSALRRTATSAGLELKDLYEAVGDALHWEYDAVARELIEMIDGERYRQEKKEVFADHRSVARQAEEQAAEQRRSAPRQAEEQAAGQQARKAKNCPSCGEYGLAKAGFCIYCFYDTKKGERVAPPPTVPTDKFLRTHKATVLGSLAVCVVGAAVAFGILAYVTEFDYNKMGVGLAIIAIVAVLFFLISLAANQSYLRCEACAAMCDLGDLHHWKGRCPRCAHEQFMYKRKLAEKVVSRKRPAFSARETVTTAYRYAIERHKTLLDLEKEQDNIWTEPKGDWPGTS